MDVNSSSIRFSILILADREDGTDSAGVIRSDDRSKFCLRHPGGPVPGEAEQLGVRLLPYRTPGTLKPSRFRAAAARVSRFAARAPFRLTDPQDPAFRPRTPQKTPAHS